VAKSLNLVCVNNSYLKVSVNSAYL
jgi:hypothetical protein